MKRFAPVLFLVAFAAASLAFAEDQVSIHVRTVFATDAPGGMPGFDSRLGGYRRQLHQLFHYTSYRLVKQEDRETPFGNRNNFDIPGGRYLEVLPVQFKEDRMRLRVLLIEGTNQAPPLDTDFTVPNHGNIWVGGPRNPDGALLISIGAEAIR